jgi:hypothetical protein
VTKTCDRCIHFKKVDAFKKRKDKIKGDALCLSASFYLKKDCVVIIGDKKAEKCKNFEERFYE